MGHWLEWARLLVHLHIALDEPLAWLLDDAQALFRTAVADGWDVDGAEGLVYTVDWAGQPVVRQRMHWVVTEATSAAAVLARVTGDPAYREWEERWWDYAERFPIDRRAAAGTTSSTPTTVRRDGVAREAGRLPRLPRDHPHPRSACVERGCCGAGHGGVR